MKQVFADTGYWIALFYHHDEWHSLAKSLETDLLSKATIIITSDLVLTEFMNFFTKFPPKTRQQIAQAVISLQKHPNIMVNYSNSALFNRAVTLYHNRADQQWSLTDCHSFVIMEDLEITDALASDKHFKQAGFKILFS